MGKSIIKLLKLKRETVIIFLLITAVTTYSSEKEKIKVAAEPDYPPYSIVNEDNHADGFSVDLFKAAAKAVELEVDFTVGLWSNIKEDLTNEKIDALPLVGRTPEREELYDFTFPYLSVHGAVFVKEGIKGIESLSDLKGKKIVVMQSDNAEEFVRRENITDKIYTTTTYQEAFLKLSQGLYDALIAQRITGLNIIDTLELSNIETVDFQIPEFKQDFCFAVKKGDTELLAKLNEGLSIIIADKTYDELYLKWFGPEIDKSFSAHYLIRPALYSLSGIVILMIILWIVTLKREVKKRSSHLQIEIEGHKSTLKKLQKEQQLHKESEKQIRLLLNSTVEGIFGIDNNGICTFINDSALNHLRYSNAEECIGQQIENLIRKKDNQCYNNQESAAIQVTETGDDIHIDNKIIWRKDNTCFNAEYHAHPIIKNEKVIGSVITFWDTTKKIEAQNELINLKNDLKRKVKERTAELNSKVEKLNKNQKAMLFLIEDLNNISKELKKEREKLQESNRELEAFTYSVSHDLRAPLRTINWYTDFLIEDYAPSLDSEGKRFIDTIQKGAKKMDNLITDLLNMSRISRNSMTFSKTNMQELVKSVYTNIATSKEQKEFIFKVKDIPIAYCDKKLITQVWQNLISNSLKYSTHSSNKYIEVGAKESKTGDEVLYYIKDNGTGFDNNHVEKIFSLFQRLHPDKEFEGTGIGLAIVSRIINRHNGKVWAHGEVGKGALFTFSLPKINRDYVQ
ncbi:transporter substrate-binding domain-containing protein [Marinilabiliaceae bacterium ANBcel2]|nr:transporter substrate-binding domain-containing protein [Marinilabiliaceae bacterium ANBcel2]